MITNKAIHTVLRCLGLSEMRISYVMYHHAQALVPYSHIEDFEEIRHHELSVIFKNVYRQNKYLGDT